MKDLQKPKEELIGELNRLRGEIDSWKRATRPISETERFLSNVFASIQDGISILDKDYTIVSVNPTMEKWYRHAMPLIGKKCYEAYHCRDKACDICPTRETLKNREASRKLVPMTGPGGKITGWIDLYSFPLIDSETNEIQGVIEYVRDITDYKKAEEELKESEARFQQLAENSQEWIWEVDRDGLYTYASRAVEKILGYKPEEIVQKKHFYDLFFPEGKEGLKRVALEAFAKGEPFREFVNKNIHKNGNVVWLLTGGVPKFNKEGDLTGYRGVDTNITERKNTENEILREKDFSDKVINSLPGVFYLISEKGRFVRWNNNLEKVTKYSSSEISRMNPLDFFPKEEKGLVADNIQKIFAQGQADIEANVITKDGQTIPYHLTGHRLIVDGQRYFVGVGIDIADRKKAEEALKDSEKKFRAIFDNATDGIVVINPRSKKIFMFNKTVADMLEYTEEEFRALGPEDFHVKEDWPYIKRKFDKMMKRDISEMEDIPVMKKDGTIFYSSITSYIIDISGDEFVVAVFRDITDRKKTEQKLEILNKYLIKTNEKLQFLAMRDYHTGLYNYHYLVDIVEAELGRAKRYASALSAIMIDIDYFKSINEIYGSKTGDTVLKQFGMQLKKAVRKYDIITRFGGEEFVILCPSTDRKAVAGLASRMLEAIGTHNFGTKEQSIKLKLSIGVATFPDARVIKGMDLVEASEKATNEAKYSGGNRVADFSDIKDKKTKSDTKAKSNVSGLKRKLDRLTKETNQNLVEAIFAFAKTIELKDHYTGEHVEKTVHYATELARKLDMSPQEIERIRQAAVLHDLGKIGISDKILLKKSKLTTKEYNTIKRHPQIAADILRPIQILHNIIPYIFYHHEKWNGSGYPSGLKGDEIPIGARIIALADVYQALTSDRPYRKAYDSVKTEKIIKDGSGTQFDPKVVKAFLDLLKKEKKNKKEKKRNRHTCPKPPPK